MDWAPHPPLNSEDPEANVDKAWVRDHLLQPALDRGFNGLGLLPNPDLAGCVPAVDPTGAVLGYGYPLSAAGQPLSGYLALPIVWTSATLSLGAAERAAFSGAVLFCNGAADQVLTVDAGAGNGFVLAVVHEGTAALGFAASGGLTLRNRRNHSASAGRYAGQTLIVRGTNLYLLGDTA